MNTYVETVHTKEFIHEQVTIDDPFLFQLHRHKTLQLGEEAARQAYHWSSVSAGETEFGRLAPGTEYT